MSEKIKIAKIIYEAKYLTIDQKLKLIKNIQESKVINEITPGSVEAIVGIGSYSAILAGIAGIVALTDKYSRYYSRHCNGIKNKEERISCKFESKINANKKAIQHAEKIQETICLKTKNPKKCQEAINKKLLMLEKEVKRLEYLRSNNKKDMASVWKPHPEEEI